MKTKVVKEVKDKKKKARTNDEYEQMLIDFVKDELREII